MESLIILVPVALVFSAIAIAVFLWAVRSDQYDDLDKSASSILFDDDMPTNTNTKDETNSD